MSQITPRDWLNTRTALGPYLRLQIAVTVPQVTIVKEQSRKHEHYTGKKNLFSLLEWH